MTDDEVQLQLAFSIPRIRAAARYRSSGTLILVQASGAGDYWGEYGKFHEKIQLINFAVQQHNLSMALLFQNIVTKKKETIVYQL